ncbi:MAG: FISUMP domain-containing protein [Candidatus Peribacteraceae bacterium]|nr:FISUMP domain-containing protein [Candidatus Peribacteraceae bacterium]
MEVCVSGRKPTSRVPSKERGRNPTMICAPGLLAGNRNTNGSFNNLTTNGNFWTSLQSGANAWNRNLNSGNATVNRNTNDKLNGFSVRCLKDWILKLEA